MSTVSVTISGQQAVFDGIDAMIAELQTKAGEAIQTAGLLCEAEAKANCPVDTGLLRSSINYQQIDEFSCTVGTPVVYAPYVELGTSRMRAQPYLFPAFNDAASKLEAQLKAL